MQFTVRDHLPEDFDTLWEIDQSCFAPGISYSRYELKMYIQRRTAFTLVAQATSDGADVEHAAGRMREGQFPQKEIIPNGNRVVGFIVAEFSRRKIGHVITIDVRSEARRHQLGSALLEAAELRLRSAQCQIVRLETAVDNLGALAFYKRRGYSVIETIPRYYSSGVDALLLEKDLLLPVASS